ncbi:sulfatase [Porticoccaceae bacterium]|nr:sulfatase [Porticoccaceae bacterium]
MSEDSDTRPDAPPNIVILFTDDMGYGDLSSYGHPSIQTPQLDQLASEGQRWTNFYAASAVCSPSRGALMTGKLPVTSGLYGKHKGVLFAGDPGAIPEDALTLPEALKQAGYNTAMLGKWHLGDQSYALPTRHGFDQWLGTPYSNDMNWTVGPSTKEIIAGIENGTMEIQEAMAMRKALLSEPKNEYWEVPLIESVVSDDGYRDETLGTSHDQAAMTKRYTNKAVSYIADQAAAQKPFFLYVAYNMPHVPLFRSEDSANKSVAGLYGDVIEEIDWSVGEIRSALEENGIADNTLVVFSSDNGPWLMMDQNAGSAGPFKGGKQSTFEGGMRVPGIFWWPDTIQPAVISGIGSMMDIYATALSLAGVPIDKNEMDAVDLSSALNGEPSQRKSLAYYRAGELYAFRKGQYKVHLITQGSYGPPARVVLEQPLLYHLGEDPGEKIDLSAKEPRVLKDILKAVAEHKAGINIAEPIFDQQ